MKAAQTLIDSLQLEPHPEGGYFRRTYESDISAKIGPEGADRKLLTCIYYLLTRDSPIGHLHENQSAIIHLFQLGAPIKYTLVSPEGVLSQTILGPEVDQGQQLQLVVPSGWWKASELVSGDFALISEAVSPGFEYEDMSFISKSEVKRKAKPHYEILGRFCQT